MELLSPIVTLLLVMDPLGNVPLFLSVLRTVSPERRRRVRCIRSCEYGDDRQRRQQVEVRWNGVDVD